MPTNQHRASRFELMLMECRDPDDDQHDGKFDESKTSASVLGRVLHSTLHFDRLIATSKFIVSTLVAHFYTISRGTDRIATKPRWRPFRRSSSDTDALG